MNYMSAILFEHMKIGMVFYTKPMGLTLGEIDNIVRHMGILISVTELALKDLIAHGIISAKFRDDFQLEYKITEFGNYFFQELCSANEDAAAVCKKVGAIINEADDT